ncbi:MAG: hypothetical protein Q4F79_02280 [Eubacteriales bacterium]|nr:hypothetical protein [Eubacteriales bacterium]
MQENTQPYLMICRILVLLYVPLSLLLAVSLLFTFNLVRSVLALLTIPLIFLPPFAERFFHWKRSYRFNLFYFLTLLFWYTGSYVLHLDTQIAHYTLFGHAVLGCFLVLLGLSLACRAAASLPKPQYSRLWFAFGGLFSIVCNTIIILAESILILVIGGIAISLTGVLAELAVSIVSASLFSIVLCRFGQHKGFSLLLRAVQDLAFRNRKQHSTVKITSIESMND